MDGGGDGEWNGLICFIFGALVLLSDFPGPGISWFLNPLLITSYFISSKAINFKLGLSVASVIFGLSFLLFDEIIKDEAGNYGKITGYALGYWLWILSAVVNLIGVLLIKSMQDRNVLG